MKKLTVEFIGTFFLVLTIGMCVRTGATYTPIAIGSILMVMVYSGGHISGGHYNPAVTLAAWLRGKHTVAGVIPYWLAQFAGAAVASLVVIALLGKAPAPDIHKVVPSLVVEALFTFALAWAVLNSATAKGTGVNSFYGLAIGFTVLAGAVSVGGISGGAFNPAVGLGVFLMNFESIQQFGVYCAADLAGGALAALVFRTVNGLE